MLAAIVCASCGQAARTVAVSSPRSPAGTPAPPADPGVATPAPLSQDEVTVSLRSAERRIRSALTPAAQLTRLGQDQQEAYLALAAHPEWVPGVLAALPADLRGIVGSNLTAAADLARLNGTVARMPHWRIVAPQPASRLLADYLTDAGLRFLEEGYER